jgi:predicted RND superfamily exporter protein
MAKLTAWLVTLVGLIWTLSALGIYDIPYSDVIVALAVLVIGIGKLVRNYKK